MKKYNFIRPIMLIVVALLTKSLVTNLCMLLGMEAESAKSVGFGAMVIAALVVFSRNRRSPK
ncbi:hypothetical protein [Paenibacillus qinlingensis]|uniref:Uncharacterized protein n=1 Tax=Paenibacillus qinlingensis TaxID=1837343 RepID=A0ABU1NTQ1_9BACL|nr:hypothetical protein [Paenibacillus qinlingensis]MDR6550823.1 hypothetical protein [Paenibacillus qinlingensis]